MSKKMAILIENAVGEVVEIYGEHNRNWKGPCMRIKVRLDVTKPLQRGIKLKINEESGMVDD